MAKITKEIVLKVKGYTEKHPDLSQREVAALCRIGQTSVGSILRGRYDDLLIEKPAEERFAEVGKMNGEIFANMKKSTQEEGTLFIDYKILSKILKRDVPEMFEARMKELTEV